MSLIQLTGRDLSWIWNFLNTLFRWTYKYHNFILLLDLAYSVDVCKILYNQMVLHVVLHFRDLVT